MDDNRLFAVFPVTSHTDFVGSGSTFVAVQGTMHDGVSFIPLAIEKGATTIVIQESVVLSLELMACIEAKKISVQRVDDTRKALAELSADVAGNPAKKLKIIGITGTKGKTTTTCLLAYFLRISGYKVAYMSTVHNRIGDAVYQTQFTTPQADYIHQFLAQCVTQHIDYVVMEVAAQALSMQRVHGITFDGIIFTNFDHEHLEFYGSMDAYFDAKKKILTHLKPGGVSAINGDDDWLRTIPRDGQMVTFGKKRDNHGVFLCDNDGNYHITIDTKSYYVCASQRICGEYNGYNLVAVMIMITALGIVIPDDLLLLHAFEGIPGRLEWYHLPNGARAIIDYAHNPSSFTAILQTMRPLTNHLIVIFGAGGGRDHFKRPEMGKIAAEYADCIVLTCDNPRHEDPTEIIQQITAGIPEQQRCNVIIELDREKAIYRAYYDSTKESIIVLLGKGPDEYQIIGNAKHFFSERTILQMLV